MCAHLLTIRDCAFRSVEKILESALAFKIVVERTVGRRVDDLEETWRLPPFQERNARPAAAALRAAAAALCFKGNHKSSQVVSEVGVDSCCSALLHRKLQKLIS